MQLAFGLTTALLLVVNAILYVAVLRPMNYSNSDKKFADAICHRRESASIRCWVAPRDIRPSEDWAEAIINEMDQARILVLSLDMIKLCYDILRSAASAVLISGCERSLRDGFLSRG